MDSLKPRLFAPDLVCIVFMFENPKTMGCIPFSSGKKVLPYSLDITPPSFKSPPYYLHEFAAEVCLSPIYTPLGLCDSDERRTIVSHSQTLAGESLTTRDYI